jgi:hypothetical protein
MAVYFKDWLTKKLEKNLSALADESSSENKLDEWLLKRLNTRATILQEKQAPVSRVSKVKIANITFAYKNAELIELLRKRGYAIKDGKWQEVNKTEAEINKKIRTP